MQNKTTPQKFKPFTPPVPFKQADKRAEEIVSKLSILEKIQLIGGHNYFFVKGIERFNIPRLYLSDATQGVHIRPELDNQLKKSTAFPCPISLAATWSPQLAGEYAACIGEECRTGGIAVLLGPGMNMYRISQCGRNFEYFGEDPYLAARMVERYVTGVQQTGTMATLKHFVCNNTEHRRRTSNSVVGERALHEIYLPAFKAGIDAGAMLVMTAYNLVNDEWAGQSDYVIDKLLRKDMGFKWLVVSDWWSIHDAEKAIKAGLDLDMPGHVPEDDGMFGDLQSDYVPAAAARLLEAGKITEAHIDRMAKSVIRVSLAMGLDKRPVKSRSLPVNDTRHKEVALQTAREGIVLLRNENDILPVYATKSPRLLLTGWFLHEVPAGGGSAAVEGYDHITLAHAVREKFGRNVKVQPIASDREIEKADIVVLSIGTLDSECYDMPFRLPDAMERAVHRTAALNPNTVVIVYSGRGVRMTDWHHKVAAIVYAWYPGQNGNMAVAEILSGRTNPSGKLPISIERRFEDSPGYPYLPGGERLHTDGSQDGNMDVPVFNVVYNEGIFTGYRWYDRKDIKPLYPFGYGLSYTRFEYSGMVLSKEKMKTGENLEVRLEITNTGSRTGAETVQIYVSDPGASVPRPFKELKGFIKVFLRAGECRTVNISLGPDAFAYWDKKEHRWKTTAGVFWIHAAAASNDVRLGRRVVLYE